jgi:hypothetical protein
VGDDQRGKRLGDGRDELALLARCDRIEQLGEVLAHRRAVAGNRARRQRRVDEVAQPAVVVTVDVDDVLDDLLVQRAVLDPEQLRDGHPRERRVAGAQEELRRFALEHE